MKKYSQLTLKERYNIFTLLQRGYTQRSIAEYIGVYPSTVSREIKRNRDAFSNQYDYERAYLNTKNRHKFKHKHTVITNAIEQYIRDKLTLQWSPDQIAGRIKLDKKIQISHESIYRFIYTNKASGGRLYKHLRHKNKKYHKRGNSYQARGTIRDRVMIDKRPKIVERKSRICDLEIDTVIGRNHIGALVTVVDRKSKFAIIKKVTSRQASEVTNALIEMLMSIKPIIKTITSDNGKEFANHKEIAKALDSEFYFAHPYHSWERGLNEHTNGLIRQYLPKRTDFTNISKEEIVTIQDKLNHRPRKVLNYQAAYELFFKELAKSLAV